FDYAKTRPRVRRSSHGVLFTAPRMSLYLHSDVPLRETNGGVQTSFRLKAGESKNFLLRHVEGSDPKDFSELPEPVDKTFNHTVAYWRQWIGQLEYEGR